MFISRFAARLTHGRAALRVAAAATCAVLTTLASPSLSQTLVDGPWETDNQVLCMAREGGRIYLGGWFDYVGPRTGHLVPLETNSGAVLANTLFTDGAVLAAIPDGDGGWYVSGWFKHIGGVARNGLARIRADLTLDAWNPDCYGVETLALSGTTLYVGGNLSNAEGEVRHGLAAYDISTGALLPWAPEVDGGMTSSGEVLSLAVQGSTVYFGGWFATVAGEARIGIAAVDATSGALHDWNPGGESSVVLSIIPRGDLIYLGGSFSFMGGQPRGGVAAVDATTGLSTAWNPIESSQVTALAALGSRLFVAGYFGTAGGQPRTSLAEFDLTTGAVTGWAPLFDGGVQSLGIAGGRLYAGGQFQSVDGQSRLRAVAFDLASGAVVPWDTRFSSIPTVFVPGANALLAAGQFTSCGGVSRHRLAAVDARTGVVVDWNPGADDAVRGIATGHGRVYAVGQFQHAGGLTRAGFAAIDAVSGAVLEWGPTNVTGTPQHVVAATSRVYLGGSFSAVGGVPRTKLAALDATTGALLPWNPEPSSATDVSELARGARVLYVGGNFSRIAGQTRNYAAAFDLETGALTRWNPDLSSGSPLAFAEDGAKVYMGGSFYSVRGQVHQRFAVVDTGAGVPESWSPPLNGSVRGIAVGQRNLYVSGDFNNYWMGPTALVAYDRTTHLPVPWTPFSYTSVAPELLTMTDTLLVGGSFSVIAERDRGNLAWFVEVPDRTPPEVHVVQPNGGEAAQVGQDFVLEWTATDANPLVSVFAMLSRTGPDGPWVVLGNAAHMMTWRVTGPVTTNAWLKVEAKDVYGNVGEDLSDGAFTIFSPDTTPPAVRLVTPNGLEEYAIGSPAPLRWEASDANGVPRVAFSISRTGPNGPWTLLGDNLNNSGSLGWLVPGPPVTLSAWIRLDAWDPTGNMGSDVSDQPFTIFDAPVPTFVELFTVTEDLAGARLSWRFADPLRIEAVEVQRAATEAGEWETLARPEPAAGTFVDGTAPAGESWYRLSVRMPGGEPRVTLPVRAEAAAFARLTLAAPAPNPTRGRALVSFGLPSAGRVRCALLDAQGRERAALADGEFSAGRHVAQLEAGDLAPGLYFLRLHWNGQVRVARLAIVR
ncbi:MAG: hypothetical protein U0704_14590 [Candidatus Eisenbacteria bacterium]